LTTAVGKSFVTASSTFCVPVPVYLMPGIVALRTFRRGHGLVAADVADDAGGGAVKGEGDGAVGALVDVPAFLAEQGGGEAAAVEEEDGLFLFRQAVEDRGDEFFRKDGGFFARLHAHVDDADVGHFAVVDAGEHPQQLVFAGRQALWKLSSEGVALPSRQAQPSMLARKTATSRP
jgi:hypothetical protein